MANKNKSSKSKNDESQTYLSIAIVFFIAGIAMIIPESTLASGLPFVVLGITFFILSQEKSADKRQK